LDGSIEANGNNATTNSDAGGGSGGSILMYCGRFSGHGQMKVNGGSGHSATSGGGSGGRMAIYTTTQNKFLGEYFGIGGAAGDSNKDKSEYSGGPGTIYLNERRNGYRFTQLRIDNNGRPWTHYVTLNDSLTDYEFDEMYLVRKASIHIISDDRPRTLTIHKMKGDRTGLVHVHRNQTLNVEYKDATYTITRYEHYSFNPYQRLCMVN
jgi:hypothetical protein